MLIVIDGYNFIFAVPELEKEVKVNNIEDARDRLISLLVRYKANKRYNIIIVFDSSQDCYGVSSRQDISGLEIIYSRYSKDADTEIKNIINHCENPKDTCVITKDNDIRRYVQKKGSIVIDPNTFYKEITKVLGLHKKAFSKELKSKYEGPSKAEAEKWQGIFEYEGIDAEKDLGMPTKKGCKPGDSVSGELHSKYHGPSKNEVDFWLKFFGEG